MKASELFNLREAFEMTQKNEPVGNNSKLNDGLVAKQLELISSNEAIILLAKDCCKISTREKSMYFCNVKRDGEEHVIFLERTHACIGDTCWCSPEVIVVENGNKVIVHNYEESN